MKLGAIRQTLATLAATATSGGATPTYRLTNRVKTGYVARTTLDDLFALLVSAGPLLVIRPGALDSLEQPQGQPTYSVNCDLYIGLARGTENDISAAENLLDAIRELWFVGAGPVIEITWPEPDTDVSRRECIVMHWAISVRAVGG